MTVDEHCKAVADPVAAFIQAAHVMPMGTDLTEDQMRSIQSSIRQLSQILEYRSPGAWSDK